MFATVPYNTHSLDMTKTIIDGNELIEDRQPRVSRHGTRQIAGDITCDFRASDFDPFIESAMFSSFASFDPDDDTNTDNEYERIETGRDFRFLTLVDTALDTAGDTNMPVVRRFTGAAVSTMRITVAPNTITQASFGLVGRDMVIESTPVSDANIAQPINSNPYDSFTGRIRLGDDGADLEAGGQMNIATLASVDLTLENSLAPTFVIGDERTPQLEYGRSEISGTMTAYFTNVDLINRFINETESQLIFELSAPGGGDDTYTFILPRIKINGASVPVGGPTSRLLTIPFRALRSDQTADNFLMRIEKRRFAN